MIDSNLLTLLNDMGYGCGLLNPDFEIGPYNPIFTRLSIPNVNSSKNRLTDLFPETFGLEQIFSEILNGSRKSFLIPRLTRETDTDVRYFDLSFFTTGEKKFPLMCIIRDVSDFARQQQVINQQKNEIILLENLLSRRREFLSSSILGNSEPVRQTQKIIEKLSRVPNASVLLLGESGTGKNLVANVIHYSSQNSKSPFVEINCAAIPESLLESELFGYEKGAFTNALTMRQGLIEEADGGTLFLDEIGELPLKIQVKLLSFLESRKFRRLGSNVEREVNLRLITATNRDLSQMVEDSLFREDLLFRLNVVTLNLPPLRDLGTDILIIADHFRQVFNIEFKKQVRQFSVSGKEKLLGYRWPGNVRELRNCIERAMIFIESSEIQPDDIVLGQTQKRGCAQNWEVPAQGINLEEVEQQLIRSALERTNGNKSKAARLLGLTRDTLRYRLDKYHLE